MTSLLGLLAVSAVPTDALVSTLLKMRRAGRRVVLVVVGEEPSMAIGGLSVYHVRDDVRWNDLEQLSIVSQG